MLLARLEGTDSSLTGADRPLLIYRDDATGERIELTAAALGEWAARTALLLREDCKLGARAAAEGATRIL